MTANEIIALLTAMGFGAILQSALNFYIASRKRKSEQKQQFKETRYKAIILLCHAHVYYEREKRQLEVHRPDIKSREELSDELKMEWMNMSLYASDKVILAMKKFVETENKKTFNQLILAMRKDLYGIRTKLRMDNLDLIEKNPTN